MLTGESTMNRLKRLPAALFAAAVVPRVVEEPRYTAVRTEDEFEVRRYEAYVVAELVVPGPADNAANAGFHVLTEYRSGKNSARRSFGTNSPVIQTPADASLDATGPMIPSMADNAFLVQFIMPRGLALPELPAPIDPRVRLRSLAAATQIVRRYAGTWSQQTYRKHLEILRRTTQQAGIATKGQPVFARYDAPYVLPFLRRNEIWLAVG